MFLCLIGVVWILLFWTRQDACLFRDAALTLLLTKAERKWLRDRNTGVLVEWPFWHEYSLVRQENKRLMTVIEEMGYIHGMESIVQKRSAEFLQMERLKQTAEDAQRALNDALQNERARRDEIYQMQRCHTEAVSALNAEIRRAKCDLEDALVQKNRDMSELYDEMQQVRRTMSLEIDRKQGFIEEIRGDLMERDDQIWKLKDDLAQKDGLIQQLMERNEEIQQRLIEKDKEIQRLRSQSDPQKLFCRINNVAQCFKDCVTLSYIKDPVLLSCGHIIDTPPNTAQARRCFYAACDINGHACIRCPVGCGPQSFLEPTGLKRHIEMCTGYVRELMSEMGLGEDDE